MALKPLTSVVLDPKEVKKDRKISGHYDQCGVGNLAVYVPSKLAPRNYYIPYEKLERVYQRIAVSKGSGKAFLTPILYIVFQYEGGQEKVVYFKYISDADKMFAKLKEVRPQLPLVSEKSEEKQKAKEAEERNIRTSKLSKDGARAVKELTTAKKLLENEPDLYRNLAGAAKFKRSMDLLKPQYAALAIGLTVLGLVTATFGALLYKTEHRTLSIMMLLGGIAVVFLMVNSGILPTPKKNRRYANAEYVRSLAEMKESLKHASQFPVPAEYAHPYVLELMERIVRTGRCETSKDALAILKEDLKAADSSVHLSGEEYTRVVSVKPMFLVNDYR